MKETISYAAFLRGINVGGRALIPMAALKAAFVKMGFMNVRTLLASGNVLFASVEADKKAIAEKISSGLKKIWKKDVGVLLRGRDDLEKILAAGPFAGIEMTPGVRLYVTFLGERTRPRSSAISFATPRGEFRILRATPTEVFSVLDLDLGKGTPEAMRIIEKEFGANLTTRNWNTVLRACREAGLKTGGRIP